MKWRTVAIGVLTSILASPAPPVAAEIHVTNSGADYRLTVFGNGANGNVAPTRVLEGDSVLFDQPSQVFADVLHGELYVANQFDNSITVYPLSASGDQPPLRSLIGAATLLDEPSGVVVDLVHDELVVSNFDDGEDGSVTVYTRTASGNTAPLRRIAGNATGLKWAVETAVDPVTNEIFVACQGNGPCLPACGFLAHGQRQRGADPDPRRPKPSSTPPFGIHFDPSTTRSWSPTAKARSAPSRAPRTGTRHRCGASPAPTPGCSRPWACHSWALPRS